VSYWYIAHADELLIDLDNYMRPTRSGCPWGEEFFRRRIRAAILDDKLQVREVWLVRSASEKHYQAIVRLNQSLDVIVRLTWQLHLGSDLYRGRADLMRAALKYPAPSLLIMPNKIDNFYRPPDYKCHCTEKHDTAKQHELGSRACHIWRKVRGMSPWELFGKMEKTDERFVALPLGCVPMELVMEVRR
jgi:hypothetical protein